MVIRSMHDLKIIRSEYPDCYFSIFGVQRLSSVITVDVLFLEFKRIYHRSPSTKLKQEKTKAIHCSKKKK